MDVNFSNNTYKKDYIFQSIISLFGLLLSGINFYFLTSINFYIIGFFAFQETVTSLILTTTGNFFAFSATRKKNNNKYISSLILLQIVTILYLFIIAFLIKIGLEGKFNIQFTFSLPLICLIGIRRSFYCLKINTSLGKKNYILSIINLSENLVFFILLLSLKIYISNNQNNLIEINLVNQITLLKVLSHLAPIALSIYFSYRFLKKIKISWLFLKAKSLLLLRQGLKFVPFNLSKKFIKSFGIILTSFIDANLLSLVAIANKATYPQILLDGILRRSGINKIRKKIPNNNEQGKRIFLISTFVGIIMFPFFFLLIKNSQYENLSEFIFYYFLLSLSISLRSFSWFSTALVSKYSVRLGYYASILGLTTPLFLFIFYKLPINFSIIRCLGVGLVLTSLIVIYYWELVRRNLQKKYYLDN